ncbi:MAG: hypothetical protein HWN67_13350 [Candidatus Helarchaeota archaeon]|nr:hypothetical protein [Candidatus Helarchaeota archaeon]
MAGWRTVAKNEIRLWTTRFRSNRKLFFKFITLLITVVNIGLIFYNLIFVNSMRDAQKFEQLFFTIFIIPKLSISPAQTQHAQMLFLSANIFNSLAIQLTPPIMEVTCFFIFFMAFTYPIQTSIQKLNISHFEIILSSPIKAKDMLLGNFIGRVPIYIIANFFIAPLYWTIFSMIIPLSILSYFTFTIIFLCLFIVGTFLGTISASYISLKLGQSKGGAEKAKAYFFLIGIVIAIPILSFSLFPYIFIDPNIQFIFKFLPTTWFGDIINFTLLPNFLSLEILILFIGLASIFSLGVFFLGYHYGDRFYSLELGTQTETVSIYQESRIYHFLRFLFGPLFVTQAKEFFRRRENLFRVFYGMILAMLIPVSSAIFTKQNLDFTQILSGDIFSKEYTMLITGFIFALMVGPMLGSMIMVRSKDMIWIFKKSPRGVSSLVLSFIQVNYFLIFLIIFPIVIIISIFSGFNLLYSIIFFISTNIWVFSALAISIGIQCWRPAFKERSPKMTVNIFITMAIYMPIFFLMIELFNFLSVYTNLIIPLALLGLSIGMIRFGIKKLNELE